MTLLRKISVVGLGYVGLPVAVAFGKISRVIGFDINSKRLEELKQGLDSTEEIISDDLSASDIQFTSDLKDLRQADFHIVCVPTPIGDSKQPDLRPLLAATKTVGKAIKKGDIVVFESTVYPGVTEEECAPLLELESGLISGSDFKIGYSPERINPGDKEHTFTKILKIVSGQDHEALEIISEVYLSVVTAGIHKASSIKVAEAAKVIENAQRDINIAFVNELAMIFDKMDLDTNDVLEAASTKWNFLPFKPGLVGGHCIGVDPYYLTHKAEKLGYSPQVILSGRKINDGMGSFIAQRTIKEMIHAGIQILGSSITILGITFKENCPDLRNSKVVDIITELKEFGVNVQIQDDHADPNEAQEALGITLTPFNSLKKADALVVAVAHREYGCLIPEHLDDLLIPSGIIIDIKSVIDRSSVQSSGFRFWKL